MGSNNSTHRSRDDKTCCYCGKSYPRHIAFFSRNNNAADYLSYGCRLCGSPAWRGKHINADLLWARYHAPDGMRVCTACIEAKPETAEFFFRSKLGRGGLMPECKTCHTNRVRKIIPARKQTPQGATKTCSACGNEYLATAEYFYRQKRGRYGLEAQCKACKRNRRDNTSSREYHKKWYAENADEIKRKRRAHMLANLDEHRAMKATHARNRRARLAGNGGSHTREDVIKQFEGQNHRCWWCSRKMNKRYEVDHRIPISRGGSNGPENIVISCWRCNRSKGARMPWEMEQPRLF